ncbi:hypothetical protein KSX68_22250, partial [Bacteroides caccae]
KISQLKENEPIFIVNEKKEGASCITTHLRFCACKKMGQALTSLSQNLPVSLIFCILGSQVKISQR